MRLFALMLIGCRAAPTCDLVEVAKDTPALDGGKLVATGVDTVVTERAGCMGEGRERHEVNLSPFVLAYEQDTYKGQNATSQTAYVLRDPQCAGALTMNDQPGCNMTLLQNETGSGGTTYSVVCTATTPRVDLSFQRKPR